VADNAGEETADRCDLAAQGFLRLLQQFRIVLLQDSVIMRREFPDHPLWTDPVFERDDYRAFMQDVELSLLEVEEPEEVRIRKTLPAVAERLSTLHQSLTRDINGWGVKTEEQLTQINAALGDLFGRRVALTLHSLSTAVQPAPATVAAATAVMASAVAPPPSTTSFHSVRTSPAPSAAALPRTDVSVFLTQQPPSALAAVEDSPPQYVLSRTVQTVPQLWREWTVGLGGKPSVQGLEDLYGRRWRLAHKETVLYGRRKVIIDEIRRLHATGMGIGAAVESVELIRQRGALSLYQLYLVLNRHKSR
jgi:hypothetical protein